MSFDQLKGENVLVTGANGFIGSHLIGRLLACNCNVTALIRPTSNTARLTKFISQIKLYQCDFSNSQALHKLVQKINPDRVIHLAANTNNTRGDIGFDLLRDNLYSTLNLLSGLRKTKVKSIICTGSAEEYGASSAPFLESSPAKPVSPYSASKAAMTLWCQMLYKTCELPIVVVRPFLAYGAGQDQRYLIPQAINAALRDRSLAMTAGEQVREFTYIDDLTEGFLLALLSSDALGEVVNLGTGVPIKIKQVVETIYAIIGTKARPQLGKLKYRSQEIWEFYSSNIKAKRLLAWEAKTDLISGLEQTIAWYRKNY